MPSQLYIDEKSNRRIPVWEKPFLASLRATANVYHACRSVGIARNTAYTARKRSKTFARLWNEAIEDAVDDLENAAREQAMTGNTQMMTLLLKAYRKEKFSERYHLVHHFDPEIIEMLKEIEKVAGSRNRSLISVLQETIKELSYGDDGSNTDLFEYIIQRLRPTPALAGETERNHQRLEQETTPKVTL